MKNLTLSQAREIVKSLSFEKVPETWVFDYNRMAKACRSYMKHVSHETAVAQINYYLHHFRAYAN